MKYNKPLIVTAQLHHLEEIIFIENSSFNKPWSNNQIISDIQSDMDSENWVYLIDELVVGYIFGRIIQDEFHLNNIAVHPKFLRRNIGKELLQHIISKVISSSVTIILLEVSAKNIPAQRCYESIGFSKIGIRTDYYSKGDDAILYNFNLIKNG